MGKYFEATVRSMRTQEDGTEKNVRETYLVDALSFTECEKKVTEYMQGYGKDFAITGEKFSNCEELLMLDKGDKFYSCRVSFITPDEKTQKERRKAHSYLVIADSVGDAQKAVRAYFSTTMVDYEIERIVETNIVEAID